MPPNKRPNKKALQGGTRGTKRSTRQIEEQVRAHTIGEPVSGQIQIVNYDPDWPQAFESEAAAIRIALGARALRVEHTGSTSVPGLVAKPVIDMLLVVADSADEGAYIPPLEAIGYFLRIREASWHQHRMLNRRGAQTNLHVFSKGCPEIDRILMFREWLRSNSADRTLYARTKLALARKQWKYIQDYADAKTAVVEEILARARRAAGK